MKKFRYHLSVNILPVILLLSLMAAGMVGVNLLLNKTTNPGPVLSGQMIVTVEGSQDGLHALFKGE